MKPAWFAVFLLLSTLSISIAQQQKEDPAAIIRLFYQDHPPERSIDLGDFKELSKYFTEKLARLFVQDSECAGKSESICNLDFDPFIDAQDWNDSIPFKITITPGPSGADITFRVNVNVTGKTLVYHVQKTSSGWRISDIVFPTGGSLVALLSTPVKEAPPQALEGATQFCSGHVTGAPEKDGMPGPHITWQAYFSEKPKPAVIKDYSGFFHKPDHSDELCDKIDLPGYKLDSFVEICSIKKQGPWSTCAVPTKAQTIIMISSMAVPSM